MPVSEQVADEARQGAEAAADGSSRQDQERDDQTVPYWRFAEATAKLKAKIDTLEAVVAQGTRKDPPAQPKVWTRAELQAEVAGGKITAQAAAEVWDQQLVETAKTAAVGALTQQSQDVEVRSVVTAYETAIPELGDNDSPQFKKLRSERQALVKLGLPDNAATTLAALRTAFGPVETLRRTKPADSEPFTEVGG